MGIILVFIGALWLWVVFYSEINESELTFLNFKESEIFQIELKGQGIAFYKITIANYEQNTLFVQIVDPRNNVIAEQKINTIMSVNYFDYDLDGYYIIRIINLSEKNTEFTIEYGDTKSEELVFPGIITMVGSFIIIFAAFMKIRDYSIAHP